MEKEKNDNSVLVKDLIRIAPSFEDERGGIFDILEDEDIRHIGLITSNPESIRGNHFHKKCTQWTYVIEGMVKICTQDSTKKGAAVESMVLKGGDMIKFPPLMIHTIESLGKSKILVMTNVPRIDNSYEYDTFRVKIV